MKKRIRIIIPVLLVFILVVYFAVFRGRSGSNTLTVSGNIEVTDARLSFKISGRLQERLVDEGEPVVKGQSIARLESVDQEIAVARAKSSLALEKAVLAELEAGSRPEEISGAQARMEQAGYVLKELENGSRVQEIKDAEAEFERATAAEKTASAQLKQAKADSERFTLLASTGAVGKREQELYRTQYEAAEHAYSEAQARVQMAKQRLSLKKEGSRWEQIKAAKAAYEESRAQYDLVKAGPRTETIDQARARVKVAEETLRQAELQLEYTHLRAPFDGVTLSKSAEPGEYLNPGSPVVTIGDVQNVWLRAYVNEVHLGKIKLGQEFEVTTDTYPGKKYKGRLSFISDQAEFTPKTVQTFEERVKLMYRIKIDLDNSDRELKPGMPADARIRLGR